MLNYTSYDIISLDETYFYYDMTPVYGWNKSNLRLNQYTKGKSMKKISLLMAISYSKIISWKLYDSSLNSQYFCEFIENLNCHNKILLMDNVKFHKTENVKNIVHKNNNKIIYIPPYSPQYNPIDPFYMNFEVACNFEIHIKNI